MNRPVYINAMNMFFPGEPVDNQNIEATLGMLGGRPSRSKSIVLASNQIKTRHYAIDPQTRLPTHSNASLTAAAVHGLFSKNSDLKMSDVGLLCCGTSSPDLLNPAHGQMVQGHLPGFSGEVVTTSGVCCSSMAALKMAYLSLLAGDCTAALVTGSETASKYMRAESFAHENNAEIERLKKSPAVAFGHDFLRWMLSDGAGVFYLSHAPVVGKTNFKLNWIEGRSFADEQPVCMFAGGHREAGGEILPWKDLLLECNADKRKHAMNFHQDIQQLREVITHYTVERPLTELKKKRGLNPGDYSWFLPHYSSHYFREILATSLNKIDFSIPFARWFTTLSERGNIGSASMFTFLYDLLAREQLEPGQKILGYVPESARFSVYYFELEVV